MKPLQRDRIFFLIITAYIVLVCFLGFSKSFYLRDSTLPSLESYITVHGIFTSLWMLIFLAQSILVNTRKYRKIHFRLGWAGLVVLILTVVSGFFVVFLSGQDRDKSVEHTGDSAAHLLLVLALGLIGIILRKKPAAHKRLMVFSSMILSSAGVARLNLFGFAVGPYYYIYYLFLFIPLFAILLYDLLVYRKVFIVTIFSTIAIYLGLFQTLPIWQSQTWSDFVYAITPLKTPDQPVFLDYEPELLFNGGEESFLEGPVISKEGLLYFTMLRPDSLGKLYSYVMQFDPSTMETSIAFETNDGVFNGMAMDTTGALIICDPGNHSIIRLDLSTGSTETIADSFKGKPLDEPNDVAVDANGNIFFTDPIFVKETDPSQSKRGVYRINTNKEVELIISRAQNPNGIILTSYGVLYVADSPYDPNSTTQKDGAILLYYNWPDAGFVLMSKLMEYEGEGPDGLALDDKGNVYVALYDGYRVEVYHPNGRIIDQLSFPEENPTNLAFGIREFQNTLFITTKNRLYSIRIQTTE